MYLTGTLKYDIKPQFLSEEEVRKLLINSWHSNHGSEKYFVEDIKLH